MKKLIILNIFVLMAFWITSCEDPMPNDYVESYILEALLIVDEPIRSITLMKSQPIGAIFNFDSAMVRDANVEITGDNMTMSLDFRVREDGPLGYYYKDTTYKVKPQTEYKIKITLPNGKTITGSTVTPPTTEWSFLPKELLQYPVDTLKLPATDSIGWKRVQGFEFYLVSVKNLDTANYGIYLNPPTEELNRRVFTPFGGERRFRETAVITPVANNKTSVVWNVFRWFGKHELAVYVPDWNYLRWYLQAQTKGEADPLLTSIEGGIGYFGSASILRYNFFLLKNQ